MNASSGLSIGELSGRSGFSPDTLRYYERVGIVADPGRDTSGRRAYPLRTVDRLRFVARAKALECTLDEIRELVARFDDDCAGVQTRLRGIVEARTEDWRRRTDELGATALALGGASGGGACDAVCACTAEAPAAGDEPPISCSLDAGQLGDRLAGWAAALEGVTGRSELPDGLRLALAPDADLGALARLAAAEVACCPFFRFAVTFDARGIALEVRAPRAAGEMVAAVFGDAA